MILCTKQSTYRGGRSRRPISGEHNRDKLELTVFRVARPPQSAYEPPLDE